jgi:hypothetical protein
MFKSNYLLGNFYLDFFSKGSFMLLLKSNLGKKKFFLDTKIARLKISIYISIINLTKIV